MAPEDFHQSTMDRLDLSMLTSENKYVALTFDQEYKRWYALLLGSVAITVGKEPVVFARLIHVEQEDSARVIVFTPRLLVLTDVEGVGTENPKTRTRTVARQSLHAMSVGVSNRHDVDRHDRAARTWPGTLTFTLHYDGLPEPLSFSALSYDPYKSDRVADSMELLDGLRDDLGAVSNTTRR